uniref:GB1/RHD3-type G domain-containing protein n=1 Tax=Zea mays TaxID=4577 RepID=A0A804PG53_MAIZE
MGRKWNELSSAPWRMGEAAEDEDATRMSREGKVSITSNPEEMPTMSVPRSRRPDLDLTIDDFEEDEIDPELRYSFQRNNRFLKRVFSVDALVKPLPPVMAYSVSRNINFFFRIFTQFWGGRSTTSELGQFSPVFVWLLRDFYLDLAEDNRKITPRDYLELALRPVQGGGRDISAKNVIRDSIRALFPDRECFTLVQPLNNEKDLQRLDQLPVRLKLFLSSFTQIAKYPHTYCCIYFLTMYSELLIGLDYFKKFGNFLEGSGLSALNVFAVGAGSARSKFEKLLHSSLKKAFEDYKRNAFLEADLQCSNKVQNMESKVRAACNSSNAKLDDIVRLLDDLLTEYESTAYGPGKWKRLATFLQQCLAGPVLDLFRRQLEHIDAERNALRLKCNSRDVELSEKVADADNDAKTNSEAKGLANNEHGEEIGFLEALQIAKDIALEMDIDTSFRRRREIKRKRHFDENPDETNIATQSPEESFRITYFLPIVDQAVSSLTRRFEQYQGYQKFF